MAQLQLMPNTTVLLIQGGLFLAAIAMIRRLFVNPYLAITAKRESVTSGSASTSEAMLKDNASKEEEISRKMSDALQEAQAAFEQTKNTAVEKKNTVISDADKVAAEKISKIESDVAAALESERAKIPQVVSQLRSQILAKALN